jgi:hypothetical protein
LAQLKTSNKARKIINVSEREDKINKETKRYTQNANQAAKQSIAYRKMQIFMRQYFEVSQIFSI